MYRHRLGFLVTIMPLAAAAAGCGGHDWKYQPGGRVYAAEAGRILELEAVSVHVGNAFQPWHEVLVEPCHGRERLARGGLATRAADGLPCWPANKLKVSRDLIQALYEEMPPYRHNERSRPTIEHLNREVGTFRTAYVISLKPLAVAYLDEQPDVEGYQKLATPEPWPPPNGPAVDVRWARDGSLADVHDTRRRETRDVHRPDLSSARANVVLLYPEEMDLDTAEKVTYRFPDAARGMRMRLLLLPQPEPMSRLIHFIADPQAAVDAAEHVVDFPLR